MQRENLASTSPPVRKPGAVFLLYDNRLVQCPTFVVDAGAATYYRNVSDLIVKLLSQATKSPWLDSIEAVGVASSPSTVQFLYPSRMSVRQMLDEVQPRYSSLGGTFAARNTWREFLCNAMQGIQQYLMMSGRRPTKIFIFSTDMLIVGDEASASIADALAEFRRAVGSLEQYSAHLQIHLVIVPILNQDSLPQCAVVSQQNKYSIFAEIAEHLKCMDHEYLPNTSYGFDEELRAILGRLCPEIIWKFSICSSRSGVDVSLLASVAPLTLDGVSTACGTRELVACTATTREGIHPLFIEGLGMQVSALPSSGPGTGENAMLLLALASSMAKCDRVLVFRSHDGEHANTFSYWALIPSLASSPALPMTLLKLHCRDYLLLLPLPLHCPTPEDAEFQEVKEQMEQCLADVCAVPSPYNAWIFIGGWLDREAELFASRRPGGGSAAYDHPRPDHAPTKPPGGFVSASVLANVDRSAPIPLQQKFPPADQHFAKSNAVQVIELHPGQSSDQPAAQGGSGVSYVGRRGGRGATRSRGRGTGRRASPTGPNTTQTPAREEVVALIPSPEGAPPVANDPSEAATVTGSSSSGERAAGPPRRLLKRKFATPLFASWNDDDELRLLS